MTSGIRTTFAFSNSLSRNAKHSTRMDIFQSGPRRCAGPNDDTVSARSVPKIEHPKRDVLNCLGRDMFVLPGASIISRFAFDSVAGFDEQFVGYEDDDLFLRLFVAGFDNVYINEPLTKWRMHQTSTSFSEKMARFHAPLFRKTEARTFPTSRKWLVSITRDYVAPTVHEDRDNRTHQRYLQDGQRGSKAMGRADSIFCQATSGETASSGNDDLPRLGHAGHAGSLSVSAQTIGSRGPAHAWCCVIG